MKNMGLGILKRFFSNILHVGKNVIAAGGICPAILETGEKIVAGRGTPIGTYPLGNGLYFDSSSRRLFRKEKAEFVTRQSSTLLLAFLEAENGNLSISEICNVLWPDGGGTSGRVYTAVRRLRVFLDVRRCSHSKWRLSLSAENSGFIGGKRGNAKSDTI